VYNDFSQLVQVRNSETVLTSFLYDPEGRVGLQVKKQRGILLSNYKMSTEIMSNDVQNNVKFQNVN
jgi:YD repeat-containing protein